MTNPNTLDINGAAKLLHCHPETLRIKAASNEVPGVKIGREWVFVDVDLIEYLRSQYGKDKECRSTSRKAAKRTTSLSQSTVNEYEEALGLPTRRRLSESTTKLRLVSGEKLNADTRG